MTGRSIMIQGTTSNAGKTFVVAGLCRVLAQDGYKVAPFKAQNMSTYGFVTKDGKEISRAQAVQAEAAMTEPSELMNPILLKPVNVKESKVIVNGEDTGIMPAADYYKCKEQMRGEVVKTHKKLAGQYDRVVIEGAGSPAEINLSDSDFVNMGMAEIADAPVLLVADIDRGGVFASIYGTVKLLPTEQQKRIKGIIINKFRGDKELLTAGLEMIENLTGIPVVGVLPMAKICIEDEDSISAQDGLSADLTDPAFREEQYNLLADLIRENLDMKLIYSLFEIEKPTGMPEECKYCTVAGCGGNADEDPIGCIHIYYGDGKGKTTTSLGAALRCAGDGHKVLTYQFVTTTATKEPEIISKIPGIDKVPGIPLKRFTFMMSKEEKEEVKVRNEQKLDELMQLAKSYDVLVLDEVLYAIETGLLEEEKLIHCLRKRPRHLEIILTGKNATEKLLACADFAYHVQREKFPFETGICSRLGLE